ncbi:MAG: FTR1 family protein [Candidatus Levybacteria bacterium]|nr:FTR1 family protein [Candidatus Levybacteria bacterium]
MFAAGLITFRETLEAVLVIGIVLTFIVKTNQHVFKRFVVRGVAAGIGVAVVLGFALDIFFGGLSGKTEEIFEGVLMFVTAGFLTWMILWVHRQKDVAKKIKEKVALHAEKGYGLGIFILVSTSVLREGVETVLYLKASSLIGATNQLFGAIIGIIAALGLGYGLFKWAIGVNLSRVFTVTSVFLLLFAAGLVGHGVHEFQEAGLLPIFSFDPVLNISNILDHKSTVGGLLRVVFGYTSRPTMLELVSYGSYIAFVFWLERLTDRLLAKRV